MRTVKKRSPDGGRVIIGLTGGFGTGKSTVARIFGSLGARVIDADRIAHQVTRPGTGVYRRILRSFGAPVTDARGALDRRRLAEVVFRDKRSLHALNRIVHPAVIRQMKAQIRRARRRLIVLDVPLLIEAGLQGMAGIVIVVTARRSVQRARVKRKFNLSDAQIAARIKAQMRLARKIRHADFVIDNNGTIGETRKQVIALRRQLWKSST